ncbi:MAG: hypothetical protein ACI4E0_06315 [Blautia sp.]
MERRMIADFIKYAKECFDCDIVLKHSEEPDTFESIFGSSFIKQKMEYISDIPHELLYENIFIDASFDSEVKISCDNSLFLAA